MQKIDQLPTKADFPSFMLQTLPAGPENELDMRRRLLVVVFDSDANTMMAARRILDAATAFKSPILLLGLCQTPAQETDLRRQIVMLSALVQEANLPVEAKIECGRDWLKGVETHWQEGDVVVCFGNQRTGAHHKLLERSLQTDLGATVYVFNDLTQPDPRPSHWIISLLAWAGSIGIILGFLRLQVEIGQILNGPSATITLVLSILAEFLALWFWNGLLG